MTTLKQRHQLIPASYLVLFRNEGERKEVLMARRFQTGYEDGKYSLPAGHVEEKESFSDCLVREIKEEIAIDLDAQKCEVAHVMHRDAKTEMNNERIDIYWTASEWRGEIENLEPHKCDDLSRFPLDSLPENTIPYIRHALTCIQDGVMYGEYGYE